MLEEDEDDDILEKDVLNQRTARPAPNLNVTTTPIPIPTPTHHHTGRTGQMARAAGVLQQTSQIDAQSQSKFDLPLVSAPPPVRQHYSGRAGQRAHVVGINTTNLCRVTTEWAPNTTQQWANTTNATNLCRVTSQHH